MIRKGPRNLITDVPGLVVGNAEDVAARSGVTVVLPEAPAAAVVDVRGGAPGTRETDALDPVSLVEGIDGLFLAGGSAFGLDAGGGVQAHLRRLGRGYQVAPGLPPVPVVAGAILFDLASGNKDWGDTPPYRRLGQAAAAAAGPDFRLGNAGAGLGAVAGAYKGGLGSASAVTDSGFTVGALVAVNAVGSPLLPGSDVFWAWPFEIDGEFGGRRPQSPPPIASALPADIKGAIQPGTNTTIAVVATDADLSRVELKRLAIMAADGFARALRPVHTPFDGDLVYALATARRPLPELRPPAVLELGALAADTLARAIARAVYEAQSLGDCRSYRDRFPGP